MSLATNYLGLELSNPLVASASPLNNKLDNIRRLEDAGAGAIVLPSLFQEQIEAETEARISLMEAYADSSPEARSYFHASVGGPYGLRPDRYLDLVRRAREAVAIPVIASLNGCSRAEWIDHARLLEEAGASGLVLFNRVLEPDIDLSRMQLVDTLALSDPTDMRQPMIWISLLSGRSKASLAASGGVSTVDDVVKYLLAGADVVMTTRYDMKSNT